jgi:2'-5' RNA ligase
MIKNFAEFVSESEMNEKKGDTYTKGCVMAYLDDLEPTVAGIQSKITEDELYEEEGDRTFGLENEPHVTVLWGIHSDEVSEDEVLDTIKGIEWKQPIIVGHLSLFENEKYDVLKLTADAEWLKEANKKLCESLPYSNDYPDYNAHVTIAYIKPGKGKELVERLDEIKEKIIPTKMVYSLPNGEKRIIEA